MSQFSVLPSSAAAANPSVGTNGATAPTSSTEIAGVNPSGNLQPLQTDGSGNLLVSTTLTGTPNVNLADVGGSPISIGQQASAASLPVVLPAAQITALTPPTTVTVTQATGTNLHAVIDASALPTGASTSALQSSIQSAVGSSASTAVTVQGSASGVALPVSISGTSPLPMGASTAALQSSVQGTVVPGTAASNSNLSGMVYNSSTQVPSNGQQLSMQSDAMGNLQVSEPDFYVFGASAQTAVINNILVTPPSTSAVDLANYRSAAVQVVSTGTAGTFIFEGSNDNTNFQAIPVYNQNIITGTPIVAAITATASQFVYVFPINLRFIRLRIASTITGGSITAFSRFSQAAYSPAVTQVTQATAGNLNVTATVGTVTAVTTVTNTNSIYSVVDQASAAIATTTTGAAKVLAAGCVPSLNVAITAATGTNPTYDFQIQSSIDGVNYQTIYQAPRQTTTGFFQTPPLMVQGIDYRYIETISGSTPSFTRVITSNRQNSTGLMLRNLIDRAIVPSTSNSTTASLYVEGCDSYSMIVNQGTGGSSVTFVMDGSDDNLNWVQGITAVSGVLGGATPVVCSYNGGVFRYIRGRVVTGVASATISYITLTGSPTALTQEGRGSVTAPIQNVYTSTNITTSAFTQLVASTLAAVNVVDIFDSSGQAMILAVGPSGQEVIQAYIPPGGESQIPLAIPAGARISYKALSANATAGYLLINFLT